MGKFCKEIPDDPKLVEWIVDQKIFHVATAPLNGACPFIIPCFPVAHELAGGRVNVSPKGLQSFKLVNKRACWYLDLTGSGVSLPRTF